MCSMTYQYFFLWINDFEKFMEFHVHDAFLSTGLFVIFYFGFFVECMLYQGLLDLHTLLRDPNRDTQCGHLPVAAFVDCKYP